ncbi:MAG: Ada metal-binding domain-containing protein, partial [Desulfobacteraceae bacterium]|nr:Ada metal-binding domain-containing protein [Desulfobacteraceae bacterium]
MQIKRFEAKNMTEALRRIKRELGPEAVILSAKDRRRENRLLGISRKIGVEVTAAIDEEYADMPARRPTSLPSPAADPTGAPSAAMMASGKQHPGILHKINDIVRLKGQGRRAESLWPASPPPGLPPTATPSHRHHPPETVQAAGADTRKVSANDHSMGRYLAKTGLSAGTLALDDKGQTIIALVGNAGVGKTTTIAKLAAQFQLTRNVSVGLLSLDRSRIGGQEQLQCYADSMQLPLESPANEKDLRQSMARLKGCRVILVDTPAVNPGDPNGLSRIQTAVKPLGPVKYLMVLSAESREEDLQDTAMRYAALTPAGIIISKTDLTRSYRDMVNFLCRHRWPVYFFSHGHRVPMDLTRATLERLAARFLMDGTSRTGNGNGPVGLADHRLTATASDGQVYLANKNSDIFHRPGCKWIRLINQTNIVEFTSFAEALNNRFKPCRYCNPQHL